VEEREVKLGLRPGVRLPTPEALLDGLASWTVETIEQHAVYYDTRDLALTRAGASLRYRSDDGWTVKIPRSRDRSTFVRDEYSFVGPLGVPPPAALDLVRAWTRSRPVVEVASLDTKRCKIHVYDTRGEPVVEVDADEVAASVNGGTATRFREVEIEWKPDADPRLVKTLVTRLRKSGADDDDPMPKIARALGARATEPPDIPRPKTPGGKATVGELVQASIAGGVQRLVENDPVVRIGEDPEGVHQARVATRRLRSDLQTLRPVLDTDWSEPLRGELRWLGELLGRVRDADVLLGLLSEKAKALNDDERSHAHKLIDRLRVMRERDHTNLLDAMRSDRYTALLDRLVDGARAPRLRAGMGPQPASKVVGKLVHRPVRRLRKQIRSLPENPADPEIHEVRKRAKQARYALEAVAPISGTAAARAARRLADLQGVLGDHQDAVVAVAWLRDAARDYEGADTPFVAGRLSGAFDADRIRLRARWRAYWKRAKRILADVG
jgi:CHAD domain-containing protein